MSAFPNARPEPRRPEPPDGGDGDGGATLPEAAKPGPIAIAIGVIAVLGVLIYVASSVWTEILWFNQLGAQRIIWTRWGSMAALFVVGALIAFLVVYFSVSWAYKRRPEGGRGASSANLRAYQEAIEPLRKLLFIGVPALIALGAGGTMAGAWQEVLTFFNATSFGKTDPQFGMDVSFFVFLMPLLKTLAGYVLNLLVMSLIGASVVHYLWGGLTLFPRPSATKAARMQIGLLAAGVSVIIGLRYLLGVYDLVTKNGTQWDGAMYTDINATLPAHMILAVISVLIAVLFLIAAFRGTWKLPVVGVVVTVVSALVIGGAYPALIQQFKVTPNARALESPYIQRNIDATLDAFGLDEMEYKTYAARTDASSGQLRDDADSTSQIRLLDPLVVSKTVQQLQQSRPYYSFNAEMAVDRYTVGDERRDTVIAMRELDLTGLSPDQQTWVNQHTVYTHGFGVVAAYGNSVTSGGMPSYWEESIPSKGEMGEYEPRIYFSPKSPDYSVVGAPEGGDAQELDYPDDNAAGGQVRNTFSGDGGPSIGNLWNKLLYAIKFQSTDLFFSGQVNSESQILYDRDPLQRVAKVAPYLTLEQKAYPAVVDDDDDPSTPKRLVWVVDAYTTSNSYPYAEHQLLTDTTVDSRSTQAGAFIQGNSVNYMRNSVKAVVDAYDGSVDLYEWDQEDPVLKTWMKIYPDSVKPLSEISGDLMSHMRYPEDLFKVQRNLLTSYHVTDAGQFYTGGDVWRLAQDTATTNQQETQPGQTAPTQLQPPYYLTMQMPDQESAEFSLTSVFVPGGESKREAMAGFLAVDSETGNEKGKIREGFGKLRLMALPSSTTVPGPGQVQNLIDSNDTVAQKLNLLDQQGSTVIRGNLLTLPVGGGLLYVQPIYVQGTGNASYPVLRSVLTAFGSQIGFASTLEESLDQVFGGDSAATLADSTGAKDADGKDGAPAAPQTAEQKLNQALVDASKAMAESDTAMTSGDWTKYGEAQKKLDDAIKRAVDAQAEQGGDVSEAQTGADGAQSGAAAGGGGS